MRKTFALIALAALALALAAGDVSARCHRGHRHARHGQCQASGAAYYGGCASGACR